MYSISPMYYRTTPVDLKLLGYNIPAKVFYHSIINLMLVIKFRVSLHIQAILSTRVKSILRIPPGLILIGGTVMEYIHLPIYHGVWDPRLVGVCI